MIWGVMGHFESVSMDELRSRRLTTDQESLAPIILVVDDERVIADTLATILTDCGFAALPTYDGESALEMAAVVPPDLVITDVVMPGMSGIDLAVEISRTFPESRVILFSGQAATTVMAEDARRSGHQFGIIAKPIHPSELLKLVRDVLPQAPGPAMAV